MTDFSYLSYEPVVYGTVLPMTYVNTVEYSPIRRAYIDSLISSLIDLQTEPEVVFYIDRLKDCRNREWDAEVLKLVNDAMTVYNRRYIYLNGGGQHGGDLGSTVGKFVSKFGSKAAKYAQTQGKKFAEKGVGMIKGTYDPSKSKGFMGQALGQIKRSGQELGHSAQAAVERKIAQIGQPQSQALTGQLGGAAELVGLEQARLAEDMARLERYA